MFMVRLLKQRWEIGDLFRLQSTLNFDIPHWTVHPSFSDETTIGSRQVQRPLWRWTWRHLQQISRQTQGRGFGRIDTIGSKLLRHRRSGMPLASIGYLRWLCIVFQMQRGC